MCCMLRVAESVHNTLPADHDQQNKLEGHEVYERKQARQQWSIRAKGRLTKLRVESYRQNNS